MKLKVLSEKFWKDPRTGTPKKFYRTTKKFLEIFGLRNLKELPTLSQIDELLPEGIGEEEAVAKPLLSDITDNLASSVSNSFSQSEDELEKIQSQLEEITTSSDFFEQEKQKQREKKDLEKAQNIREALAVGQQVSTRDLNWLKRYDEALMAGATSSVDEQMEDTVGKQGDVSETEEFEVEEDSLEESQIMEDDLR
ncbi:MAG: hypothetical protein JNM39_04510 [Bdellovibrionaceae bacterium]|nr:hypothetical protein [Pseudobdellovibrionaceae bacterium]